MQKTSPEPDDVPTVRATEAGVARAVPDRELVSRTGPDPVAITAAQPTQALDRAQPPGYAPTETGSAQPAAAAAQHAGAAARPPDIVRYGPGVPGTQTAGKSGLTASHVWHAGDPDKRPRRRARLGRLAGWVLTAILLVASAVVLYLRFHHAAFRVTGAVITEQVPNGCGVDVTGRITTNGSGGTVSYQWRLGSDQHAPQPLNQSVVAGQDAVYVTVAVEGQGHGAASEIVTLQVLGPQRETASARVAISCP